MSADDTDPANWPAPGEPDGPQMDRISLLMASTHQQESGESAA